MVASADPVPQGVTLSFVDHTGAQRLADVDDLAMFECSLPDGSYACAVSAGGVTTPTLVEFSVP
jgi:hypothetical protein